MLLVLALVGALVTYSGDMALQRLGSSLAPCPETHIGVASWYGPGFYGRHTASGEVLNKAGLTAAHKTLPFGTHVLITNLKNGKQVEVIINDRGPYIRGRVIDLSRRAAEQIGLIPEGTGRVRISIK